MPWHCEMGGQSKSIKSFNSGQSLGDPSPQGDLDNHQILLFKRWHVYKLFKPLSFFGRFETQLLFDQIQLIYYCVLWECQLAGFLYCAFCHGQDAALHFDIDLSWLFMYLCLFKTVFLTKASSESTKNVTEEKRRLLPHWITNAVTSLLVSVYQSKVKTYK